MSKTPTNWYLSDENQQKAELSAIEANGMADRALRCPNCGHVAMILYEDLKFGHASLKCVKCCRIFTVNFEYYRRPRNGCYLFPFNYFCDDNNAELG